MTPQIEPTSAQERALAASDWMRSEKGWEVLRDFASLLQIPNVTGSMSDLRANASELTELFQDLGATIDVVELVDASPVVVGELRTARPTATLGVYVHYDGQPVDPDQWTTPPFSATLASGTWHENGEPIEYPLPGDPIDPEWRIYARGASDDKTPFAAIRAALQALGSVDLEPTIDLVFLFEGEEESGSPTDVGESARNVIPSAETASIDIRLAAGDDPDRMLDRVQDRRESEGYVVLGREPASEERRQHRRLAKMTRTPGYPAVRTPMDSPLAETLLDATRVAAGGDVVALPTFGGSIPLHHFDEILGSPVAIVPIANHDNNQHADDENVRVANIWYGIDLWTALLTTDFSTLRER